MNDLLAVLITLSPNKIPENFRAHRWWGGFAHGLLMKVLHEYDPEQADYYHQLAGFKPYTVSDLIGSRPNRSFSQDKNYQLRYTSLEPGLTQIFISALSDGGFKIGQTVSLGGVEFLITGQNLESADWSGMTNYLTLSQASLMPGKGLDPRITFQFGSPTTFKSGNRFHPLPLPEQVFNGLMQRWSHWSQVAFPQELRTFIAESLVTTRYGLHTRLADSKEGGVRPGAVGKITYTALSDDGYWLSLLHTLASYAKYAGVGSGVTQGMGQARKI